MFRIKRGLDLPIAGEPTQRVDEARMPTKVGVLGADFPGLKPSLLVAEGERVQRGQALIVIAGARGSCSPPRPLALSPRSIVANAGSSFRWRLR